VAFVYADRVKESSTSGGVGDIVLDGAAPSFQSFEEGVGEGNQTYYVIIEDVTNAWEIGIGTYSNGKLIRDTVLASTAAGAHVFFAVSPKTVGGSIAKEFYDTALVISDHAGIDHTGVAGVPPPEAFTSSVHDTIDHTTAPFNILNEALHATIDHTQFPLGLLTGPIHNLIDHTGLPGVNDFDADAHTALNHQGLWGVPNPELFTALAHSELDHTGLQGIPSPVSISAETVIASSTSNTTNINLTAGTWTVLAFGAWRSDSIFSTTYLRIGGVNVSAITDPGVSSFSDPAWLTHFGTREGLVGPALITIDFDNAGGSLGGYSCSQLFALAVRTA